MSGVLTTRKNLENERKRRRGNNKKHCCSHTNHRSCTISNLIAESFANGQWPIANGGQWRAATCLFKFLAFSRRGVGELCALCIAVGEDPATRRCTWLSCARGRAVSYYSMGEAPGPLLLFLCCARPRRAALCNHLRVGLLCRIVDGGHPEPIFPAVRDCVRHRRCALRSLACRPAVSYRSRGRHRALLLCFAWPRRCAW